MRFGWKIVVLLLLAGLCVGPSAAQAATPSGFVIVANPVKAGILYGVAAVSASNIWAVGGHGGGYGTVSEHWDGGKWSAVATPHPGIQRGLNAVSAGGGSVWAVGWWITDNQDLGHGLILRWSGSKWLRIVEPSYVGGLFGVKVISASNVWAVGETAGADEGLSLVIHWNGSSWSNVSDTHEADQGRVLGIATPASQLFTVGYGDSLPTYDQTGFFDRRVGSTWTTLDTLDTGYDLLSGVSASSTTNVWAVGEAENPTTHEEDPAAVRWNGKTATEIDPPGYATTSHVLNAVAAISPTNVWAVGYRYNTTGIATFTLIDHYTSSGWTDLGGPNSGEGNVLEAIAQVPGSSSNLWAVGVGSTGPLILHHS